MAAGAAGAGMGARAGFRREPEVLALPGMGGAETYGGALRPGSGALAYGGAEVPGWLGLVGCPGGRR